MRVVSAWLVSFAAVAVFSQEEECVGKVVVGVWTSAKTMSRRRAVKDTWFRKGCVVWLSCCPIDEEDTIVTGGPDTYVGVTYRGLIGLKMMRERFPNTQWFGMLGDDNYVHWPSLLRGLETLKTTVPIVAGERVAHKGTFRFMGGAGIFHNGIFADRFANLAESLAKESLTSTEVHDLFFSRVVLRHRDTLGANLTSVDFLFSTEPAVYICGHGQKLAANWPQSAPAVFHRFRTYDHMLRMHTIATGLLLRRRNIDGVMKRSRFIAHLQCSLGQIADALCLVWHNCPAG